MKKTLILTTVVFFILVIVIACSITKKDTQIQDKLDLSKMSFKLKIQDAYMTNVFGIYGELENEIGIVIHGTIENGKIHENSKIIFVDENGKVLFIDKVFKIEIEESTSSSYSSKSQSFAESGDDVALYLKAGKIDDLLSQNSESEKNLDLIRKSHFAVLDYSLSRQVITLYSKYCHKLYKEMILWIQ